MKARKKIVSLILALALILSTLAIGVSAVLGDGQEISVDVNLEVGWQTGDVFTPLAPGEELQAGDVLTVRICPTTDFLTGITRYIVMYSKPMFKVVGEQKDAFTPNYAHPFWASVASGWTGATGTAGAGVPTRGWPESMLSTAEGGDGTFDNYTAVAVNNLAGPASGSGGYPGYLTTGEWLFRFNLTVLQDITDASQARIWMDKRWLAGPSYTQGAMYFVKCTPTQYAALGSAIAYAYDLDLTGADITLPLAGGVETSTITFDSDGGTAVDPITQEEGSAVTAPADPTKDGFIFDGWQPAVPATMPVDDMTCVAQWIPVPFATSTITFDSDGGTAVDPITQEEGSAVTAPADPTKDGFIFDGWQPAVPATMPVDDMTCVAQWIPVPFATSTITFDSDGGTAVDPITQEEGSAVTAPADPTKDGFIFDGWQPAVPATMPVDDMTCVAQWIPVPFATSTITFDSDGGTAVDPITQEEGSAVTAPADPTKDGFIFDGWQPAVPATMPVDDVTCVAQWAVNTYNAIFMVDGAVYATVPTVFGAAIAPPANPAKFGYVFTGWDPVPGTMGAADETFTALFEDSTLNVFNAALPPHYFGQLAPITISVIGSPSKIQLLNKGNDTTRTFSRTNTNVVSIQGYDSQNNPVEAGAEPAYEVWVINVALKQGDFSVRAKYNKTWDSFEAGFLLTVDFVDPAFYSFDIDNANVIQGSTSVFTVVTSLDVTKVQFVDGKGNTRTFTTDKAVCTDDQAAFTRTWTINVKVAKAGSYNWILKGRSGTTWTTTGLSVSFDVVKGA